MHVHELLVVVRATTTRMAHFEIRHETLCSGDSTSGETLDDVEIICVSIYQDGGPLFPIMS